MTIPDDQLQQALAPLVRSIDKVEAQQTRLADKFDNLYSIFATRQEHVTLTTIVSNVAAQVTQLAEQVERNREKVERTNSEGGKWILDKFDAIEQRLTTKLDAQTQAAEEQFNTYKQDQRGSKQWLVGLLYGTVSGVVVGLIILIAQYFLSHP